MKSSATTNVCMYPGVHWYYLLHVLMHALLDCHNFQIPVICTMTVQAPASHCPSADRQHVFT
jgi:hypothetical protein